MLPSPLKTFLAQAKPAKAPPAGDVQTPTKETKDRSVQKHCHDTRAATTVGTVEGMKTSLFLCRQSIYLLYTLITLNNIFCIKTMVLIVIERGLGHQSGFSLACKIKCDQILIHLFEILL